MGYLPEPTPEMGEYHVEVRRESFYIRGEDDYDYLFQEDANAPKPRHILNVYPNGRPMAPEWYDHERRFYLGGNVEALIEDIPKIRAALEQVERIVNGNPLNE